MKYDYRNDLFLFLLLATIILTAYFFGGCTYVLKSDYDRVHEVAMSALKRNVKLIMTNDSLLTEIERCQESKKFKVSRFSKQAKIAAEETNKELGLTK